MSRTRSTWSAPSAVGWAGVARRRRRRPLRPAQMLVRGFPLRSGDSLTNRVADALLELEKYEMAVQGDDYDESELSQKVRRAVFLPLRSATARLWPQLGWGRRGPPGGGGGERALDSGRGLQGGDKQGPRPLSPARG